MSEEQIIHDVSKMMEVAQKVNAESEDLPSEFSTKEETDKTVAKLENNIETMKNRGENILSRLRAGVISRDVAKKQMKNLLINGCGDMLGVMMKINKVSPDINISEDDIKAAMEDVNKKLS